MVTVPGYSGTPLPRKLGISPGTGCCSAPGLATLRRALPAAMTRTTIAGRCWVAWPKRALGVVTDLSENAVRDAALPVGWVDVVVCAIDAVWSGLCLVRHRENR